MKAMQEWTEQLSVMQQSVLISAVRGPDGIRKDHVAKAILRWYRRCILISAFDKGAITSPLTSGGGSFTGPVPTEFWPGAHVAPSHQDGTYPRHLELEVLHNISDAFLKTQDELPFHFFMHVLHSAEILGYKHPVPWIRDWWCLFYLRMVNDQHLYPESEQSMDQRLSDSEVEWRAREEATAAN